VSTDSERVGGRQSHQLGIVEVDDFTVRLYYLNLPAHNYHLISSSSSSSSNRSSIFTEFIIITSLFHTKQHDKSHFNIEQTTRYACIKTKGGYFEHSLS